MFRLDFGFCQHRHEVGVACPAGHDVCVKVFVKAGPSAFADVVTDIETIGMIHLAQDVDGFLKQLARFDHLVLAEFGKTGEVAIG